MDNGEQKPRSSWLGADAGVAKRNWKRIFGVILTLMVIFGVAWYVFWFILYRDDGPTVSTTLPEVVASPTSIAIIDPWAQYSKLSQAQARELRGTVNVINIAILDGGATYLADRAVILDPEQPGSWQQADLPLGFSALSVNGTGIAVTVEGKTYHLNCYQAFALQGSEQLYMVDQTGQIWSTQLSDVTLVPLDEATTVLPIQIEPNGELTFTN